MELTGELWAVVQMHLSPRHSALLAQTCQRQRAILGGNEEYWLRVAAHLVWRCSVLGIWGTRLAAMYYVDDGYYAAMGKAMAEIHKHVDLLTTTVYEGDDPFAEEARNKAAYWMGHANASLETKTRMQLKYEKWDQTPLGGLFTAEECLAMPMKAIAQRVLPHFLDSWPLHAAKPKDPMGARKLRAWARAFAEMPGISSSVKARLMGRLMDCLGGHFTEGGFATLDYAHVVRVVNALRAPP